MIRTRGHGATALKDLVTLAWEDPAGVLALLRAMSQLSVGVIIHRLDAYAWPAFPRPGKRTKRPNNQVRPDTGVRPATAEGAPFEVIEGGVGSWKERGTTMRKPRVNVNKPVLINDTFRAECINLSNDGMFIFTSRPFEISTDVELCIDLGGDHLMLEGNVRHRQPGVGFGVQLNEPPRQLKSFVGRMLAGR